MLSVRVGGQRLGTIAAHGPVTVEYSRHGSEAASWEMDDKVRHRSLRGNAPVDIYDGGFRVWVGTLNEPGSDGQFDAKGLWHEATRVYALGSTEDMTSNPQDALAWARTRGDLTWNEDPGNWAGVAWGNPTEPMTVEQLLDAVTAEAGTNWYIDPVDKKPKHAALPTTPKWLVPHAVAGKGLTPAEDEFYTHLVGTYKDAGGVSRQRTVGSADAAGAFGRRVRLVNLSDLGNTTTTRVDAVLTGMLLKSGARMGWGEGLELGHGQITTTGGTPAALSQITSQQMVRLSGTVDTTKPYIIRGYTDIVLETVKYTDGSGKISATPFGYAPRNHEDILKAAVTA